MDGIEQDGMISYLRQAASFPFLSIARRMTNRPENCPRRRQTRVVVHPSKSWSCLLCQTVEIHRLSMILASLLFPLPQWRVKAFVAAMRSMQHLFGDFRQKRHVSTQRSKLSLTTLRKRLTICRLDADSL